MHRVAVLLYNHKPSSVFIEVGISWSAMIDADVPALHTTSFGRTTMSEAQLFATMTFAEIYERVLVQPLFRPFAEELIARLEPAQGDSLVDVACGTGIVARIARQKLGPGAQVVGIDVAPAMLAVARQVEPSIDWREGNAISLPIDDSERFSLLTCHQGLQFFPDKAHAVRGMHRVLAPKGRVAIATWRSLHEMPVALELNTIAERHVGRIIDSRYSFGDANALKTLLEDAGFQDVRVGTFSRDVRFADGALFARLNAMAVIGMSEKGKALPDAERSELAVQIASDSRETIARLMRNGECVFPMSTNIATGYASSLGLSSSDT
jgi:ubiquinone/menaquinone biosynthesis C-methylase UbiE